MRIDADAFRKAHKLTAVFLMGRAGGTAVIDGTMVEVGQRFDGLVLAGVTAGAATLQGQGNVIVLRIDTAAEAAALSRTLSTREKQVK